MSIPPNGHAFARGLFLAGLLSVFGHAVATADVAPADVAPAAQDGDASFSEIGFSEIAQAFLDELGVEPGREDGLDLYSQVQVEQFVRLPLGLFELHYPEHRLGQKDGCEQLQSIALGLLDLQDRWIHLAQGLRQRRGKYAADETPVLRKWIKSWKPTGSSHGIAPETGSPMVDLQRSLTDLFPASEEVEDALLKLATRLRSGQDLEWQAEAAPGAVVVLAPDRGTFVGLCAVLGLARESSRGSAWVPATFQRTVFQSSGQQILALEYADPAAAEGEYRQGLSMNARDKTGELQHVIHHGALHLVGTFFGESLDPAMESGLATHLTVDVLGEDNARVGGSANGSSVAGRSKFVVGGRSEGGKFPKLSAESSWRVDKGEDYFLGALRSGQKRGQKEMPKGAPAPLRNGWFLLEAASGGEGLAVRAPLLGDEPGTSDVPADYLDDAQELFRAYGCGFVHWLREQKAKGDKSAEVTFARLLRESSRDGADFPAVVVAIYGVPLTGADAGSDALEWQFLKDLARR